LAFVCFLTRRNPYLQPVMARFGRKRPALATVSDRERFDEWIVVYLTPLKLFTSTRSAQEGTLSESFCDEVTFP
jgi:hypothetical protein